MDFYLLGLFPKQFIDSNGQIYLNCIGRDVDYLIKRSDFIVWSLEIGKCLDFNDF